jgi:hypothetical protein
MHAQQKKTTQKIHNVTEMMDPEIAMIEKLISFQILKTPLMTEQQSILFLKSFTENKTLKVLYIIMAISGSIISVT